MRLATAITGDEQTAHDAVHDGFVRAVRYRSRLRDCESAPGWVCRIVLNEARKRTSADRRHVSSPIELADGIMPFLWSAARIAKSKAWVDR